MNWFDILVIIVAIYAFIKGYSSGLIKQLASLAGIIACILLSGKVSLLILPYLRNLGKIPDNLIEPAAYIASFLLIFAVFMLIGHMLQSILQAVHLGMLNKLAGSVLSLAKWMIIISLLVNLIAKIDKNNSIIPSDMDSRSKTYGYIQPIATVIAPYLKFDFSENESE